MDKYFMNIERPCSCGIVHYCPVDVYSGKVKRAPRVFIRLGLEWFYRLLSDPRRIGRMLKLPQFYFGTLIYKLKNRK